METPQRSRSRPHGSARPRPGPRGPRSWEGEGKRPEPRDLRGRGAPPSLRAEGPPAPHGLWGGDPKEPWAGPPELPRFLPSSGRTARSVRYAHLSATGVLGGRSLRAPWGVCATPSCVASLSPIPGEQNASLSRDSVSEMPEGDSRPDERFWRRFQRLKWGRAAAGAGAAGPLSARRLLALRQGDCRGRPARPAPAPPAGAAAGAHVLQTLTAR